MKQIILLALLLTCGAGGTAEAEHRFTLKCEGTESHWELAPTFKPRVDTKITVYYTLYVRTEKDAEKQTMESLPVPTKLDFGRWYDWERGEWYQISSYDERAYTLYFLKDNRTYSDNFIDRRSGAWVRTDNYGIDTPDDVRDVVNGRCIEVPLRVPPGPKF
jgi:hypothetical protein